MLNTVRSRLPPAAPLLLTVAVVLLLAVLAAAGDSAVVVGQGWIPGFGPVNLPPPGETDPLLRTDDFETPAALRAAAVIGLLAMTLYVLVVLVIGLAMLVAGLRLSRQRRRRETIAAAEAPQEEERTDPVPLRTAAAAALERLRGRSGRPPGDAVVAAWLELERATADVGQAREPHQTPSEYTAAVTARLGLNEDAVAAVQRLRELYQQARFSDRAVGLAQVGTAEEALARIVTDLDASRAGAAR